jgi:hypothetical protein
LVRGVFPVLMRKLTVLYINFLPHLHTILYIFILFEHKNTYKKMKNLLLLHIEVNFVLKKAPLEYIFISLGTIAAPKRQNRLFTA